MHQKLIAIFWANLLTVLKKPMWMACKVVITDVNDVDGTVSFNLDIIYRIPADDKDGLLIVNSLVFPASPATFLSVKEEDMKTPELVAKFKALFIKIVIEDEIETNLISKSCLCNVETKSLNLLRSYKITMEEKMELHRFPFDRQLVEIKIRTWNCHFAPWPKGEGNEDKRKDAPLKWRGDHEWKDSEVYVEYHSADWKISTLNNYFQFDTTVSNLYVVDIGIERDPTYYLNNCILVVFIIVQVAVFVIAIDPSDFGTRSSLTITLLLTIVAFKFVANGFIPKVNYLTYLDKYIAMGFVALMLEIVENFGVAMVATYAFPLGAFYFDLTFNIIFDIIWIIGHTFLLYAAYTKKFSIPWDELEKQRDNLIIVSCSHKKSEKPPVQRKDPHS